MEDPAALISEGFPKSFLSFVYIYMCVFDFLGYPSNSLPFTQSQITHLEMRCEHRVISFYHKYNATFQEVNAKFSQLTQHVPQFWLKLLQKDDYLANYLPKLGVSETRHALSFCIGAFYYPLSPSKATIVFVCIPYVPVLETLRFFCIVFYR